MMHTDQVKMDRLRRLVCTIVCGQLWGALLSIAVSLGVFIAKNNELVPNPYGEIGACILFAQSEFEDNIIYGNPNFDICQFVIWGSATAMVLIAILGVHTIILAFFKYTG